MEQTDSEIRDDSWWTDWKTLTGFHTFTDVADHSHRCVNWLVLSQLWGSACHLVNHEWTCASERESRNLNPPVSYLILPPGPNSPCFVHTRGMYANKRQPCVCSMKSLAMKSPLAISSAWRLTCRVPQPPSVWVQRHTQNRRRYSLNAPSRGGRPEPRKQSNRSRDRGQVHSGEWRPAITAASGSSYTKLCPVKNTRSRFRCFCMSLSVRFLYLLYQKHVDKSPVLAARLSRAIPTGHNRPTNSIPVMAAGKLWTNIYAWPDWVLKSLFSPPVLVPFRQVSGLLPGVLCDRHSQRSITQSLQLSPSVLRSIRGRLWHWANELWHSSGRESV